MFVSDSVGTPDEYTKDEQSRIRRNSGAIRAAESFTSAAAAPGLAERSLWAFVRFRRIVTQPRQSATGQRQRLCRPAALSPCRARRWDADVPRSGAQIEMRVSSSIAWKATLSKGKEFGALALAISIAPATARWWAI